MRHSAVDFLALIKVMSGFGISLRNTILFRVFHILRIRATNLSILIAGLTVLLALLSICIILRCASKEVVMLSQLWKTANLQHSCETVHPKNKWVVSSRIVLQKGQFELMDIPCWARVPLVGSDA